MSTLLSMRVAKYVDIPWTGMLLTRISAGDQATLLFVVSGTGTGDDQPVEERDGLMLSLGEGGLLATTDHLELALPALPKVRQNAESHRDAREPAVANA